MNRLALSLVVCSWWWGGPGALVFGAATQPATTPPDPQIIALAIAQLGDASFEVREQAMRLLWSAGSAAEAALKEAATDADPEVAARAREILADFQVGIRPDSPAQIIELTRTYRRNGPTEKRAAIDALFALGLKAYPTIGRLGESEPDPQLRDWILRRLGQQASVAVAAFLANGEYGAVEQLLEIALLDGSDLTARSYAVYHLLRGQADAKIRQLRAVLSGPHAPGVARALTYLYRARGDLAGARWAAENTGDIELLDNVLFEQDDWKTLANRLRQRFGDDADVEQLGYLAAYQRLAGDDKALEHSLLLLRRYAEGPRANQEQLAKALLLNDRPDEAIAIYAKAGNVHTAFELLCARQKYKDALELATQKPIPDGVAGLAMRCSMARALHHLGQRKDAEALFDQAATQVPAGVGLAERFVLIEAERQCGLVDRAYEHAVEAVAEAGRTGSLQSLFRAAFGAQTTDAVRWWNYFRSKYPTDSGQETLRRMRDLLQNKLTAEQLTKLADDATQFAKGMSNRDRGTFLALVGKTVLGGGQEQAGQRILDAAAELGGDIELGTLAGARGQWALAARLFAGVAQREKTNPVAASLQGWAMLAAGQEKEGRQLIAKTDLLLLADSRQRLALAETLTRAGLAEGARQQLQLILRTAPFGSAELIEGMSDAAYNAVSKGDHPAAAAYWQRSLLACLQSGAGFVRQKNYITLPLLVRKSRAAGLIAAGKIDEAMKQMEACESLMPGEITVAIDLVPVLERTGHAKEADAVYGRVMVAARKLCEDFPRSAAMHNSVAWLGARLRRDLEKSLEHAKKAVELGPTNAAILDTLAEVNFQLGNRAAAIGLLEKCVALEPSVARHRAALKRVKEASPESEPIE